MPSKQFEHLQEASLLRLRVLIPGPCPLTVRRLDSGGFCVSTIDGRDELRGRFQVVASYIAGYVDCWRRRPTVDAVSRVR
jgi:hypothetical protein